MKRELRLEIFLKKSQLRKDVWDKIDGHKTASELAKELGKHRSAVSRVLLAMEEEGLANCLNSEDVSFRVYEKK